MSAAELAALGPDQLGELRRSRADAPVTDSARRSIAHAGDADARRALLVDAVIALLRLAGPVVLVLDDIHWIDAPSLRRAATGRWRPRSPTSRSSARTATPTSAGRPARGGARRPAPDRRGAPPDRRRHRRCRRGASSSSARRAAPLDAATISLGHAIHARTAGNPLFVRRADHPPRGADAERRLPTDRVRRCAKLPDGPRRADRPPASSRLGEDAWTCCASRLPSGSASTSASSRRPSSSTASADSPTEATTDVLALLERARDAGVVVDDGDGMEFRHAVIRSALLDAMSTARRQRLHRDIATVLERMWASSLDRHLEELAYHHDRARSAGRAAVVPASGRGGRRRARRQRRRPRRSRPRAARRPPSSPTRCCAATCSSPAPSACGSPGAETIADARRATDAADRARRPGAHRRVRCCR